MSREDQISAIYEMCIEFKEKHAKSETHFEYIKSELKDIREETKEKLQDLRTDTDILKEHKANFLGKVTMLGMFIGGIFTLIGYWISKKL